jgi:ABC-type sugar transport system permease subunit
MTMLIKTLISKLHTASFWNNFHNQKIGKLNNLYSNWEEEDQRVFKQPNSTMVTVLSLSFIQSINNLYSHRPYLGHRGHDRMAVGFITT